VQAVATLQVVHRRYPDPCVPELLGAGRAVPDAAEDWATQGGRVKTDWTNAPFVAEYRDINLRVCDCAPYGAAGCPDSCASSSNWYAAPDLCQLSEKQLRQMRAVQLGYTIYDYCADGKRYNGTVPLECSMRQY
jgi:xyloglucan:xyloglucosyl transferase